MACPVPFLVSTHNPQVVIQHSDRLTFLGETLSLDFSLWLWFENQQVFSLSFLVLLTAPGAGELTTGAVQELWLVLEMIIS